MQKIKKIVFENRLWFLIGTAVLGAGLGFLYWQQVGCASGHCAITSSPINSTVYGTVMGYLLGSMFVPEKR